MNEATALATALVLAGVGYGAWRWLLRRLRHCEDRLEECIGRKEEPP